MHAALASALNAGDGPGVRQLLRGTPSLLNRCDFNGDPFLISAIRQGSPDVVRPLLGLLSPQEALDLMESSSGSGGGGMVGEEDASALLAAAADVDARNRAGENALHVCARLGRVGLASLCFTAGADVAAVTSNASRSTALHFAAEAGKAPMMDVLLRRGADINARDAQGRTPLHSAVRFGRELAVRFLLDAGADFRLIDQRGRTAIHWAAAQSDIDIAVMLVERALAQEATHRAVTVEEEESSSGAARRTLSPAPLRSSGSALSRLTSAPSSGITVRRSASTVRASDIDDVESGAGGASSDDAGGAARQRIAGSHARCPASLSGALRRGGAVARGAMAWATAACGIVHVPLHAVSDRVGMMLVNGDGKNAIDIVEEVSRSWAESEKKTPSDGGRGLGRGGGGGGSLAEATAAASPVGKQIASQRSRMRRLARLLRAVSSGSGAGRSSYVLQLRLALETGRVGRIVAQSLYPIAVVVASALYALLLRPALLKSAAVRERVVPRAVCAMLHALMVVSAVVATACYCYASLRMPDVHGRSSAGGGSSSAAADLRGSSGGGWATATRAGKFAARCACSVGSAPFMLVAFTLGALARVVAPRAMSAASPAASMPQAASLSALREACAGLFSRCSSAALAATRRIDRAGDSCGRSSPLDDLALPANATARSASTSILPLPNAQTMSSTIDRDGGVARLRSEYEWAIAHGAVSFSPLQVMLHVRSGNAGGGGEKRWVHRAKASLVVDGDAHTGATVAGGVGGESSSRRWVQLMLDNAGDLYCVSADNSSGSATTGPSRLHASAGEFALKRSPDQRAVITLVRTESRLLSSSGAHPPSSLREVLTETWITPSTGDARAWVVAFNAVSANAGGAGGVPLCDVQLVAAAAAQRPAIDVDAWQLCSTCGVRRPLRSKHARVAEIDGCVAEFDHFCPWVGNAIGRSNRAAFIGLVAFGAVAALTWLLVLFWFVFAHSEHLHPVLLLSLVVVTACVGWLGSFSVLLIWRNGNQIVRNLTTNEVLHWTRYEYLHVNQVRAVSPPCRVRGAVLPIRACATYSPLRVSAHPSLSTYTLSHTQRLEEPFDNPFDAGTPRANCAWFWEPVVSNIAPVAMRRRCIATRALVKGGCAAGKTREKKGLELQLPV